MVDRATCDFAIAPHCDWAGRGERPPKGAPSGHAVATAVRTDSALPGAFALGGRLDRATEDDALLKGNAPSAFEWKDAWGLLSEMCSMRAGGRIFEKNHSEAKADPLKNKKRKRYR